MESRHVGAKDRPTNRVSAQVVEATDAATLIPFVESHAAQGATIYTDVALAYASLASLFNQYQHETVKHSVWATPPRRAQEMEVLIWHLQTSTLPNQL